MSFDSFKDKPSSQKVTLVEIDVGVNQQTWINKEAGIWAFQYTPDASKIYDGSLGYGDTEDDTYNTAIYKIGSVKIDGEVYIEVDDIASLRTNNKSFYYDSSTTFIYIRFDNWNPPEIYSSISLGITSAYANQQIDLDGYTYYARVKGIPNISKKKDALFFGVIQYTGGNITLDNTDGEFGTFIHKDIFSQETRVLFGGDTLTRDDYREGFTGYLEDFDISSGSFTININDKRKFLSRKIPTTYFDSATYPNIKDNLVGKSIPLAYGELRNISVN